MSSKIPTNTEELMERMKKLGVTDDDLEKFQEELDDADHDIESIKEDIKDKEESMLFDFFRDELDGGVKVYDVVKSIMNGILYKNADDNNKRDNKDKIKEDTEPTEPTDNEPPKVPEADDEKRYEQKEEDRQDPFVLFKPFNKTPNQSGDGTVILNAGLIIIPDDVITDEYYLENIEGISYVLAHNNARIIPPRLPYSYIEFWREYLDEEKPKYKQIADDISHSEGPTYDYLMEHPPNDRILPVLEKVVDQLEYPILDSNKEKRASKTYEDDIKTFFREQTPGFYKYALNDDKLFKNLIKTCILFKKNTNDTNFNTFELCINIMDIYDRILYDYDQFGVKSPDQITGRDIKEDQQKINELQKKHHFASKLQEDDYLALNDTLVNFKNIKNESLFLSKLETNTGNDKINDNLGDFQCISLSFILFIKAFMSKTTNCLEEGYHIYKAPKSKKGKKTKKSKEFVLNIKPLKDIKIENNEGKDVLIDDSDVFFHNDNFPLQFDLCIIPKQTLNDKDVKDYGLEEKYNDFGIESRSYTPPTDKHSIYKLYGDMIEAFRNLIKNKNNMDKSNQDKKNRRDDRYCIVFHQNKKKFYMYPPHINNGDDDAKIMHRKQEKTKQSEDKTDNQQKQEVDNMDNDEKKDEEQKVRNKYSLIADEYNDLTNFYLTSKCIIPSKQHGKYYGIDKVEFLLSAHFHKQRQWHRHPKLRMYQYFNGGGLRFFYSNKQINKYQIDKDLIKLWPKYFKQKNSKIDEKFIENLGIFDAVMDLYKCDAQYFRWDNAVKRQISNK